MYNWAEVAERTEHVYCRLPTPCGLWVRMQRFVLLWVTLPGLTIHQNARTWPICWVYLSGYLDRPMSLLPRSRVVNAPRGDRFRQSGLESRGTKGTIYNTLGPVRGT